MKLYYATKIESGIQSNRKSACEEINESKNKWIM